MSIQARATQYGKLFGNWKIREFIGEGSQGKTGVFRIIKNYENFHDENALKVVTVLREDGWPEELTEEARQNYEANKAALCAQAVNEVKLMNRLAGDPYVVSYQNWEFCDWEESGQFGCDLLIQMPMLVTLKRLQRTDGYFSGEEIRRVGRDICKALIRCGEEGILHRDIKPANIFLPSNRKGNYMLGDFGISRIVENGLGSASTSVGTLDYAAPEQFGSEYDSRVDIYSLGLTLYELANQNCLPFWKPGHSSAEAIKQRLSGSILSPPSQADSELAQIILKACAFRPEDRYQTAEEFLAALDDVQPRPIPLPPKPEPDPESDPIPVPIPPDPVPPTPVKLKFIVAGICTAAILVIAIVAAILHGGSDQIQGSNSIDGDAGISSGPPQSTDVTDVPVGPIQPPNSEPDHASMYHITLTVGDEVTVREYNEALPILTERLNLFTGGEPYEMTVGDDFIDLYLPKEAFGDYEIETALNGYITIPTNLYIFDISAGIYYDEVTKEALSRDDLESVILMEGTIEGLDASEHGIDTPTYKYIEVTLTDQYAQQYSQEITEWGENLRFAEDIAAPGGRYFDTFPAGNGKTFYILGKRQNFLKLVECNWTHPPLPFSFGITNDLNNKVEWQSLEEAVVVGKNQREASELTGDTVTFLIRHYRNDLTAGELLDLETEMKARLDILDQPYAYGLVEDTDHYTLAVRTGLDHMGDPIMGMISGSSSITLGTNFVVTYLRCESLSWEKEASGTYCVTVKVTENYADELTMLSGWMVEQGGGTLSLLKGSFYEPLFSTDIDQQIEDGTVAFRHICFDGRGDGANITDNDVWLFQLMNWTCASSIPTINLEIGDVQMNLENMVVTPVDSKYGVSYVQEAETITNAILSIVPNAAITIEGSEVIVNLGLDVNEDLPATAAAVAQDIYESSGFEASIYRDLIINLIDGKDSESGYIYFRKWIDSIDYNDETVTDGYIYVRGAFTNGRLERYKEAFKNIVETDPFYTSLTVEDATHWEYE